MIKHISSIIIIVAAIITPFLASAKKGKREYYQLNVYHFSTPEQERRMDEYIGNALIPFLHRSGIKAVGAFKPVANDTAPDKIVYVFLPLKNLDQLLKLNERYVSDNQLVQDTRYFDTGFINPPFNRKEIIVLEAFDLAMTMRLPGLKGPKSERIYELRSYESATDKLHRNKMDMFNKGGEIALFARLNFNAVFYSRVIAGSRMPNLMYMTCFENMADRDAHWKTFSSDPEWKKLSTSPEYQHNVSKNDTRLLHAAAYSDF